MARKISEAGIKLIHSFEGCRLKAYKPVSTEKYWTIGWGSYGEHVKEGMTITQAEADALFLKDIAKYEAYVNNPIYVPFTEKLNQNQYDALVSFCYNCGGRGLQRLCEDRTIDDIPNHLPKWNTGGGVVLAGLTRRRAAEVELYKKPVASETKTPKKEVVKVDKATKDAAKAAIDQLAKAGKLSSPDYWKAKVEADEAMPVWAYMIMESRKLSGK